MVAWPRVGLTRARMSKMSKKKRVFTVFRPTRAAYARRLVTDVVLNLEPHCAGQRGPRPKDCAS